MWAFPVLFLQKLYEVNILFPAVIDCSTHKSKLIANSYFTEFKMLGFEKSWPLMRLFLK